jgi:hypothetical protein
MIVKKRKAKKKEKIIPHEGRFIRDLAAVACPECNGYADRVKCTKEEIKNQICGRKGYECCCRAFKCRICGARIVGNAQSPEME